MPAPLCRQCGKAIAKRTRSVYVRQGEGHSSDRTSDWHYTLRVEVLPRSKADCTKLTNEQIVSVRYHRSDSYRPQDNGTVEMFTSWDGTSYVDEFFCNGGCCDKFAYGAARGGYSTKAYRDAVVKQASRQEQAA